jgi:hypothetical protein
MTDHPDHPDDRAETKAERKAEKVKETQMKALAQLLGAFGTPNPDLQHYAGIDESTTCWLTIGNIQIGPVGYESLLQQLVDPAPSHAPAPERAPEPETKKRA